MGPGRGSVHQQLTVGGGFGGSVAKEAAVGARCLRQLWEKALRGSTSPMGDGGRWRRSEVGLGISREDRGGWGQAAKGLETETEGLVSEPVENRKNEGGSIGPVGVGVSL